MALARDAARETVFLVGGAPRDLLTGRAPFDLDLAVAKPEPLARALASRLRRKLIVLDEGEQVYRIATPTLQLDVARLKGPTIEADLARRDFTIDALAAPLSEDGLGPLLDPTGGAGDLKRGVVRATSERAFIDDPLRLLRAYRLSAELGFAVEPRTRGWITRRRALIAKPSGERLHDELLRLLDTGRAAATLKAMDETRLLTALFPELEAARTCARVYYGAGGVLKHSLDTVERIDFLFENLKRAFGPLAPKLEAHIARRDGPFSLKSILRLTALLHDVAKPPTAKKIEGRLRFFGHEPLGAKMAEKILDRLRFSSAHKALIMAVIAEHLRPGNLAANHNISDRAVFRFFQDLGGHGVDLLLVCWADHSSYLTPAQLKGVLPYACRDPRHARYERVDEPRRKTLRHLQVVAYLLRQNYERPDTVRPPKLADGNDVMRLLKLKPSPKIGEILNALHEAQAEGKVKTKAEALAFISSLAV